MDIWNLGDDVEQVPKPPLPPPFPNPPSPCTMTCSGRNNKPSQTKISGMKQLHPRIDENRFAFRRDRMVFLSPKATHLY